MLINGRATSRRLKVLFRRAYGNLIGRQNGETKNLFPNEKISRLTVVIVGVGATTGMTESSGVPVVSRLAMILRVK